MAIAASMLWKSASMLTGLARCRSAPATPIISLTANAMPHHIREYAEAGMDAFVAKPIEAGRLFEAVQTALAEPAAPAAKPSKRAGPSR